MKEGTIQFSVGNKSFYPDARNEGLLSFAICKGGTKTDLHYREFGKNIQSAYNKWLNRNVYYIISR